MEASSLTPNNEEIKRIMGDHAALSANYKDIPPLFRPNPTSSGLGAARPKSTGN